MTTDIIATAHAKSIPVVFALKKSEMAKAMGKRMGMSFASIVNVEGAHEAFRDILLLSAEMRTEKRLIDQWVTSNAFNDCGDPLGTEYQKHPLLNSGTGALSDRYRFLVQKFPSKPWRSPFPLPELTSQPLSEPDSMPLLELSLDETQQTE